MEDSNWAPLVDFVTRRLKGASRPQQQQQQHGQGGGSPALQPAPLVSAGGPPPLHSPHLLPALSGSAQDLLQLQQQQQQHHIHHPSQQSQSKMGPQPYTHRPMNSSQLSSQQLQAPVPPGSHAPNSGGPLQLSGRLHDLLEAVKNEFENTFQDVGVYKLERDDLEQRLTGQITEQSALQQSLYELERAHQKVKQTYEDEIHRLRRDLEGRGHVSIPAPSGMDSRNPHRPPPGFPEGVPPPILGNSKAHTGTGGVFSAFMSSQGGPGSAGLAGGGPVGDSRVLQQPYMNGAGGVDSQGNKRMRPEEQAGPAGNRDAMGPPNPYLTRGDPMGRSSESMPGPYMPPQPPHTDRDRDRTKKPKKNAMPQEESFRPSSKEQPPASNSYNGGPSNQYGHMGQHGQSGGPGPTSLPSMQQQLAPGRSGTPTQVPQHSNAYAPTQHSLALLQYMQGQYPNHEITGICDLDQETAPPGYVKEGSDWVVVYNHKSPSMQRNRMNVELVHSLDHGTVVCCVKFSPDGKFLATGCNRLAYVYDAYTGTKISTLIDESAPKECDLYIRSVCFSPDGKFLATGAEDRVIRVWDIARREILFSLVGHEQDIYSLDWSRDGRVIVSGSGDKTVRVWDAETGKLSKVMINDDEKSLNSSPMNNVAGMKDSGVTSVAVSPMDGRCVATGSLDEMVRVWDLRTGQLLERFEGHKNSVYSVAFSPDGRSIVSGSLDKTLKIWDLSPATLTYVAKTTAANNAEEVRFEPIISSVPRHTFVGHQDYVLSVAFAGRGSSIGRVDENGVPVNWPGTEDLAEVEWLVSGSKDRSVTFWDGRAIMGGPASNPLQPLRDTGIVSQFMLHGHKNSVISVALGSVGGLFATGSGDLKARIWRVSATPPSGPQLAPIGGGAGGGPPHPQMSQLQQQQQQQQQQQPQQQTVLPPMRTERRDDERSAGPGEDKMEMDK
ncbi:general transcription repressor [Thoreauomyces humboldtii]|nr:general transcription repressor [Thoreauomyces humboldtii]